MTLTEYKSTSSFHRHKRERVYNICEMIISKVVLYANKTFVAISLAKGITMHNRAIVHFVVFI